MGPTHALTASPEAPWRQRFRVPKVIWTQLADERPDRGLAASNRSGRNQLYAWDVPSGELRQLTNRPEGLRSGFIAPDGRYVYYLDDAGGNEVGHLVRVPFVGGSPEDVTPTLPPYATFGGAISAAGNLLAFMLADADGFALVAIDLAPDGSVGLPRVLHRSAHLFWPPLVSPGGEVAVIASTERTGLQHFSLFAFDAHRGERIGELWDGPETSVETAVFARTGGPAGEASALRLAATSNRSGFRRPLVWHPATGERRDLPLAGLDGDVVPLDWSRDDKRLLLVQTSRATDRLWTFDLHTEELRALDHPDGSYWWGAYFAPTGEVFAHWQDPQHPPQVIALDPQRGALARTVVAAGTPPPGHPLRSIAYSSTDGQAIQGWLGVPEGPGPFPTILDAHGGPHEVETATYSPTAQAWLDHGFAFLSINYRGSTTFGRAFEQQIWGDLGHWELEDLVAARAWLVGEGIAQPDRVFTSGWSYGGFLTLLALGKRPELWAGGLAGIAIADWAMAYEDASDVLKGYCVTLFGGTPAERPERYAASSPITYAERVAAPVLIIQGRHDTRTPARQVAVYAERLRALGKPVEVAWFEAGHLGAFGDAEQAIAHHKRQLRFVERIMTGAAAERR